MSTCSPQEIGLSDCEYGCKTVKCSHGIRWTLHYSVYGCPKGRKRK